jgi:protein SCO1
MRETAAQRSGSASAARNQSKQGITWRRRAIWGALALVLVLAAAGVYVVKGRATPAQLVGGAIANPPQPAPVFTLTDQFGKTRGLSDLRGKPVALTFVYTHCPDVCPVISANMHQAYKQLGDRASQVGMVAVTVDPENDDVNQVHSFSDKLSLTDEWYFLTGSRPQLEAVWASYGISAQAVKSQGSAAALAQSPEVIEHAAPVFLIDKQGRVRAMLPVDVTADIIAQDLGVLLSER